MHPPAKPGQCQAGRLICCAFANREVRVKPPLPCPVPAQQAHPCGAPRAGLPLSQETPRGRTLFPNMFMSQAEVHHWILPLQLQTHETSLYLCYMSHSKCPFFSCPVLVVSQLCVPTLYLLENKGWRIFTSSISLSDNWTPCKDCLTTRCMLFLPFACRTLPCLLSACWAFVPCFSYCLGG